MTTLPAHTRLHRLVGWHAPRMRRLEVGAVAAAIVFAATVVPLGWELAALVGWDVAATLFLVTTWHLILGADPDQTRLLATVEDESRRTATIITIAVCLASLVAVALTLVEAKDVHGADRVLSIGAAMLTIVLSWAVLNSLFTLRYADAHYRTGGAVDFGGPPGEDPDYRDFAYLAFTIGMCYQVSDQALRAKHLRRIVLVHALVSYLFGVVIIAAGINLVAGLLE